MTKIEGALTLGEHLAQLGDPEGPARPSLGKRAIYGVLNAALWIFAAGLAWFWAATGFVADIKIAGIALGLGAIWVALVLWGRSRRAGTIGPKTHFLLADDTQAIMAGLRRVAKTAVIDGNNLYHFGLTEDLGAAVLRRVAGQLRIDGCRVICFFDANIFYSLIENGDYPHDQRHDKGRLCRLFDIDLNELYIVPSGVQADRYILSTLRHMPISFAVTNDRFRDYAKSYACVDLKGSDQAAKVPV